MSLSSCGGDDDNDDGGGSIVVPGDEPGGAITKITPVKEELKPFIGSWYIRGNRRYYVTFPSYQVFFFQDNKCCVVKINDSYSNSIHSWEYDSQNRYLSIAGLSAQWQITAIDDKGWSGLALWHSGDNGYTAEKGQFSPEGIFTYRLGMENTWTCDTVEAIYNRANQSLEVTKSHILPDKGVGIEYGNYKFDIKDYNSSEGWVTTDIDYDEENDVIVFDKTFWGTNRETGKLDRVTSRIFIQMVHPYSYEDIYLNIFVQDYDEKWKGKFLPKRG